MIQGGDTVWWDGLRDELEPLECWRSPVPPLHQRHDRAALLRRRVETLATAIEARGLAPAATDLLAEADFHVRTWLGQHQLEPAPAGFLVPGSTTPDGALGWIERQVGAVFQIAGDLDPWVRHHLRVALPPAISADLHWNGTLIGRTIYAPTDDAPSVGQRLRVARECLDITTDFAERASGATALGLGGTIPSLTHHGQKLSTRSNVVTGHAGTCAVLLAMLDGHLRTLDADHPSIGVIGAGGSIGTAITETVAARFPHAQVVAYDNHPDRLRRICVSSGAKPAESSDALLDSVDACVVATTSPINVSASRRCKFVIDDSQPPAIARRIGQPTVTWAIGTTASTNRAYERQGVVGGNQTMRRHADHHASEHDLWGCEAELITSVVLGTDADRRGPVDAALTRRVGQDMASIGIVPSQPQAWGQYVSEP